MRDCCNVIEVLAKIIKQDKGIIHDYIKDWSVKRSIMWMKRKWRECKRTN